MYTLGTFFKEVINNTNKAKITSFNMSAHMNNQSSLWRA